MGRHGRSDMRVVNFVRADEILTHQFHHFMNFEFSESVSPVLGRVKFHEVVPR